MGVKVYQAPRRDSAQAGKIPMTTLCPLRRSKKPLKSGSLSIHKTLPTSMHTSSSSRQPPEPRENSSTPQLFWNLQQLLGRLNVEDPRRLARVAHQLLGPDVEHAHRRVARRGHVVYHDVGHREAARGLGVVSLRPDTKVACGGDDAGRSILKSRCRGGDGSTTTTTTTPPPSPPPLDTLAGEEEHTKVIG